VAPSLGVELRPVDMRNAGEIERAITVFAASSNGGLIITGSAAATVHRELIIALAARHRLPAVYYARYYVTGGGLISYGPDFLGSQCVRHHLSGLPSPARRSSATPPRLLPRFPDRRQNRTFLRYAMSGGLNLNCELS
jgi:hypothetical protein